MILGKGEYAWMDRARVLGQFSGTKGKAIRAYRWFVEEGFGEGRNGLLTGGGLIRSQGGGKRRSNRMSAYWGAGILWIGFFGRQGSGSYAR